MNPVSQTASGNRHVVMYLGLISPTYLNATDLAEEIRQMLSEQFQIAVRVREVKGCLSNSRLLCE